MPGPITSAPSESWSSHRQPRRRPPGSTSWSTATRSWRDETPGATAKSASILVGGDNFAELNETFHLYLSEPVHASVADGVASATILNDD